MAVDCPVPQDLVWYFVKPHYLEDLPYLLANVWIWIGSFSMSLNHKKDPHFSIGGDGRGLPHCSEDARSLLGLPGFGPDVFIYPSSLANKLCPGRQTHPPLALGFLQQ